MRTGRYRWALMAVDVFTIATSVMLAVGLRAAVPLPLNPRELLGLLPVYPWVAFLWWATLAVGGAYRPRMWGVGVDEYRQVAHLSVLFTMALGLLAFLLDYPLSRGFLVILLLVGVPMIVLGRLASRRLLQRFRRQGQFRIPTLVAGQLEAAEDLVVVLQRECWLGYEAVGLAVGSPEERESSVLVPVVGSCRNVLQALDDTGAHAVIFASGAVERGHEFNEMARKLEAHRAEMIVVPAITDVSARRIHTTVVAGLPLMHVGKPRALRSLRLSKRLFDLVVSITLILLASPLFALVALLVKREDGGPVLFCQSRIGRGGEPFGMFKFRSMVPDAEAIMTSAEFRAANESDGVLFKIKDDPRITRVGKFLRRYSVDELPQLFNVVRGDMSLVGPRPALGREVACYDDRTRRRLDVRPGMTGLWQVSGRSDLSWEDTVRLDLYYVNNWSLLQDLVILARTAKAVVSPAGAY